MYAREIKALEQMSRGSENSEPWKIESLYAAIELMRAAEPKDAEAELAHCRQAVAATGWETSSVPDLLMRERALARAEVAAKNARLVAVGKRVDEEGWRLGGCTRETLRELQASLRELEGK